MQSKDVPGLRNVVPLEPLTMESFSTLYCVTSVFQALAGTFYVKVWLLPR